MVEESEGRGMLEGLVKGATLQGHTPDSNTSAKRGNLFLLTGISGIGKSSVLEEVVRSGEKVEPYLSYTDRQRRYPSEDTHKFLSRPQMDALIEKTENDGTPHTLWENRESRYVIVREEVEQMLNDGKDVIMSLVTPKPIKEATKVWDALPIYLKGKFLEARKLMRKDRPEEEVTANILDAENMRFYYDFSRRHGSVIKYNLKARTEKAQNQIMHAALRIVDIINYRRKHSDLHGAEMHSEFVKTVENLISGSEEPLAKGREIQLPGDVVAEYIQIRPSTIKGTVTIRISGIDDSKGVRYISMLPAEENANAVSRDALQALLQLLLAREGIYPADVHYPVDHILNQLQNPVSFELSKRYSFSLRSNANSSGVTQIRYGMTDSLPSGRLWKPADSHNVFLCL